MKFTESLNEAKKLGKLDRELDRLVIEEYLKFSNIKVRVKYLNFIVERFLRNEKKIASFGFLEKRAYNIGYHDSILCV